jgi:RimJ/RimL family protein N-acetyltransferase
VPDATSRHLPPNAGHHTSFHEIIYELCLHRGIRCCHGTPRGKGYATEAAGAVLEYALGPLGLPEVLAEVDQGNTASIAVIERLGMTRFDVVAGQLGPMTRYRRAAGTA